MSKPLLVLLLAAFTAEAAEPPIVDLTFKEAELVKRVKPIYPGVARKAGVTGMVAVEAIIDTDGTVGEMRLIKSIPLLDQAALDCLKQWTFKPAVEDGEPARARLTVWFRFDIEGPGGGSDIDWDFEQGVVSFREGKYDDAIAAFGRSIESSPKFPDPYFNVGLCYQKKKEFEPSASYMRKAIERDPDLAAAHFNLGLALFALGKPAEGLAELKETCRIDESAEGAYNCGVLLKAASRHDEAIEMLALCLQRDDEYADGYREMALCRAAKGDKEGATSALARYLKLRPDAPDAAAVKQALAR